MNKLSRRRFLMMSALAFGAGGLLSACARVEIAKNESLKASPTPTAGAAEQLHNLFRDPPELQLARDGRSVRGAIEAKPAQVNIGGANANFLTYNGTFPAPTIRVKSGEVLRLTFRNSLPANLGKNAIERDMSTTNLHTHGLHVSPAKNSDNIFIHLASGEELVYEYDFSKQPGGMAGFYHPHLHGTVAEQVWRGMSGGAVVVEEETNELSGYETHILLVKDITLSDSSPAQYTPADYIMGKIGDVVTVNGQVMRLRIINSCSARFLKLSLEEHKMHLVGCDGGLLDKPYSISEIIMSPAERVDVLIEADRSPGDYELLSLPYGSAKNQAMLLTLSYKGTRTNDSLPQSIASKMADKVKFLRTLDASSLRQVNLSFNFAKGKGAINGQIFDENPNVLTSKLGTYEVWVMENKMGMDHPLHQHVNAGVVLGIKVEDYTGDTVFHCHILEHGDIGMMGVWKIV